MNIYNYDENSKEFLFVSVAQNNPKRPEEYLIPDCATVICPPDINENETVVFNGEFWDILDDFRGLKQINIETKEISTVKELGKLKRGFMLYSEYVLTDDYKEYIENRKKDELRNDILAQIDSLDQKRIRAVCEPAMKDENLTWLDYYNSQIVELRKKLAEVDNDALC